MKVGITGVSSTGKSTLAKAVAQKVEGFALLLDKDIHEETFQLMEKRGLAPHTRFFPEMTTEEHINFERCITDVRLRLEDTLVDDFIADESPLDFLNYIYITCSPHPNLMAPDEQEQIMARWRNQLLKYDVIWYLPYGVLTIEDDGRRFKDKHLLQHWDNSLRGLIDHLSGEYGLAAKRQPLMGIMEMRDLDHRVEAVIQSINFFRQLN